MAQIVLDSSEFKNDIKKYKSQVINDLRISMLEGMREVATTSVDKFMTAHTVSPGEFGKPGGSRPIGKRKGGSKLGILTGRLARSIQDQDSEFGREGIRRVLTRGNILIGEIGSKVPYAAIHEKGGTINHTNLFGRGIRASIRIPKRPYLEPAVKDAKPRIEAIFNARMNLFLKKVF